MERLIGWLRSVFGSQGSSPPNPGSDRSQFASRPRADRILELQAEVRRLQQDRLALSKSIELGDRADVAASAEMATIEQAIGTAQVELAKLQARI